MGVADLHPWLLSETQYCRVRGYTIVHMIRVQRVHHPRCRSAPGTTRVRNNSSFRANKCPVYPAVNLRISL